MKKIFMHIDDDFPGSLDPHWAQLCTGGGTVQPSGSILRMAFESARQGRYTDAQIDDYHTPFLRTDFLWQPPLRMTVRARSSLPAATPDSINKSTGILRGTAGFGFWNKPVLMQGGIFMLPEAIWFFYASPPSNMALVPGIPGWGWKAQVVHTMRLGALSHVFPLSLTTVFGRLTGNTNPAARWMQRLAGAHEAILSVDMTRWHTYTLEWRHNQAVFWVDGELVLNAPQSPNRPLGFVAWLDNAYAIATPRGELRFGTVASGQPEWVEMDSVKIEKL